MKTEIAHPAEHVEPVTLNNATTAEKSGTYPKNAKPTFNAMDVASMGITKWNAGIQETKWSKTHAR